jgi:hypothetical protein
MSTEEIQDREPTPEEIAEMRERMTEYYDNQIPFLIKQKEYETLLSEIEIARARRIEASIRIAQMTMGPQEGQEEPEMVEEPKKRTLKKDK